MCQRVLIFGLGGHVILSFVFMVFTPPFKFNHHSIWAVRKRVSILVSLLSGMFFFKASPFNLRLKWVHPSLTPQQRPWRRDVTADLRFFS